MARHLIQISRDKLEVNRLRKWGKPNEKGVCHHIKENK